MSGARSVDDFLANLDDVLEAQADTPVADPEPAIPAPPVPGPPAPPLVSPVHVRRVVPPRPPFPPAVAVPPMPDYDPLDPQAFDTMLPVVDKDEPRIPKTDPAASADGPVEGREGGWRGWRGGGESAAVWQAVKDSDGTFNNPRGRRVAFAVTAGAAGWSLGLYELSATAIERADAYAVPASGVLLAVGLVGAWTRTRWGMVALPVSLALISAMQTVDPSYVVGGAVAGACHIAYWRARGWMGEHARTWPWAAVAWLCHIPTATTTLALLTYGTN